MPPKKQTKLGLYATAQEAYDRWKSNPDDIKILDVRTPNEYVYVGHAPMAVNVPLLFMDDKFDSTANKFGMVKNDNFFQLVDQKFSKIDTIFLMCRSGGRGAKACNVLSEKGYKNVYNIVDGFEGDVLKDENSYLKGKRVLNGWKNSSAPWTYDLDKDKVYEK